jgi:hypothetical protein
VPTARARATTKALDRKRQLTEITGIVPEC